MGRELYIQPGDQRPSGKPAGRLNIALGAKPRHVDEAIAAGVNMISLKLFRWRDATQRDMIWAAKCDVDRVEGRLSELGWTRWDKERTCWLPPPSILRCEECGKIMSKLPTTATCLNGDCEKAGQLIPR